MRKLSVLLLGFGLVVVGSGSALASPLVFDRGLPTTNLNNAAGSSRSNVQWAYLADPSTPNDYWLIGDDFTIAGSGSYLVDTIRLWSTSSTGLSLWFGQAGGSITQLSSAPTVTPVTYVDGSGYQGNAGTGLQIYQLDFNLGQLLAAGTTYQFFLDGPMVNYPSGTPPWTSIIDAFVHSSNAGLSGSTQEGANDLYLYANIVNGVAGGIGSDTSYLNGWDKASDVNVQIFGTDPAPVPEPATWTLLGLGLIGLAAKFKMRKA